MVLRLKTWESRSPPGPPTTPVTATPPRRKADTPTLSPPTTVHVKAPIGSWPARPGGLPAFGLFEADAGWSSPVARQAHNLKVAGSNPAPATSFTCTSRSASTRPLAGVSCVLAQRQDRRQIAPHLDRQPARPPAPARSPRPAPGSPRAPRGRPRPPAPRAAPPPSAGRSRPDRDAAAAWAPSPSASSASQRLAPALQPLHPRLHRRLVQPLLDRPDQPVDPAPDLGELAALGGEPRAGARLQSVPLGGELGHEQPEQLRIHQPVAQGVEHRRLEHVAADGQQVVAGALVARASSSRNGAG